MWDSSTLTPWYKYRDERSQWWQGYYDDAQSLAYKYSLAKKLRLRGVLVWMLNGCTRTEAPQVSTRILGRRMAHFPPFRIPHRAPRGLTPRS